MTVSKLQPPVLAGLANLQPPRLHTPSWRSRVIALRFAARLDRAVDRCEPVPPGSALAVHVERLTSTAERKLLADTLRSVLRATDHVPPGLSTIVPVHRGRVGAAADLVDEIRMLLDAPLPVRSRGVARLRLLLADGAGPLYATGRGSLSAELRGVLAAL
jgi:hypothetical protein